MVRFTERNDEDIYNNGVFAAAVRGGVAAACVRTLSPGQKAAEMARHALELMTTQLLSVEEVFRKLKPEVSMGTLGASASVASLLCGRVVRAEQPQEFRGGRGQHLRHHICGSMLVCGVVKGRLFVVSVQ